MILIRVLLGSILVCVLLAVPAHAKENSDVSSFGEGDLSGWEEKSFEGNSRYIFVDTDVGKVLQAKTEGKASVLA